MICIEERLKEMSKKVVSTETVHECYFLYLLLSVFLSNFLSEIYTVIIIMGEEKPPANVYLLSIYFVSGTVTGIGLKTQTRG